ncbi:MAG: tetratricopeptide repeat protein [Bacteroidales bacterium]
MLTYTFLVVTLINNKHANAQIQELSKINALISKGEYTNAIDEINELINNYPDSEEAAHSYIKYAYCLIKEKECGEETKYWLRMASGAQLIDDEALLNLLYGKFYHSNKMWNEAKDNYINYSNIASRKDKKQNNFESILTKCDKHELLFQPNTSLASDEALRKELERKQKQEAEKKLITQYLSNNTHQYSSIPDFVINPEIKYNSINQFKTNRGKYYYCKGKETEDKISAIEKTIDRARTSYEQTNNIDEKQKIALQVIQLEKNLLDTKQSKDSMFHAVVTNEDEFWSKASNEEKSELMSSYLTNSKNTRGNDDNSLYTYDLPEIKTKKPDPVTYTVVIASYKRAPTYSMKQINSKISKTRDVVTFTDTDDIKYYTVGSFKDKHVAEQLKSQLILEGAKNAEVVGFLNGKRVDKHSTDNGKELGAPLPKGVNKPQRSSERELIQIVK